ncbi:helix-turn-helix transcriptional regulator [Chryseobacterium polytrichastri]|uniref:HTH luxR-type domain-containing protein n=1 Tax=Chryseobacterium polytrichastri TaxID=1302687 RepID=A0A1M6RIF3_9FLAO|nr:hypothetical protein [Chryseobacterium polytrichastri]SHK32148.1 hypothetical protein SAMN05444267_10033 [Chryseobacterium polytrichastri]
MLSAFYIFYCWIGCRMRAKLILLMAFSFFSCNKVYSQKTTKEIDSLNSLIDRSYTEGTIEQKNILAQTTKLYYLSRDIKFIRGQITSLFEEAKIYYLNGDFNTALSKISEGIDLAQSIRDYNMLCRISLVYQKLLLQLDYLEDSKNILLSCKEYNELVDNDENKRVNDIYILLAEADLLSENIVKNKNLILSVKKKAYEASLKIDESNKRKKGLRIYALESLTMSMIISGDSVGARTNITEIDRLLVSYQNISFIIQGLLIKSHMEYMAGNYQEAIHYFSESIIKTNGNIYILEDIYPMISLAYGKIQDFENAAKYSWKYKKLVDRINQTKKKSGNVSTIHKINLKIFGKTKKSTTWNAVNIGILIIAGILCLTLFLFRRNIFRIKTKTDSLSEERVVTINKSTSSTHNELEALKKLTSLVKEDINIFYLEFQKVYPSFHESLKNNYSELNISDINFCSLIKMNLEIKEISIHTNSSIRSVESRRYRVIKKMKLKSQKELYFTVSTF